MPLEVGRAAIDLVAENAKKQNYQDFTVSFHGNGEPFFAFPSVKGNDGKFYNQAYALGDDLKTDIELLVKQLTE